MSTLGNPFDLAAVTAFVKKQIFGWWRIAATPWAPLITGRAWEPSAIWRLSVSIRRITSRWAKVARC